MSDKPLKIRPFLKWAGNKFQILDRVIPKLPASDCLIEPFVGSGAIFLNTDFKHYILGDCNPDLINLYELLKAQGQTFIDQCKEYFQPKYNNKEIYYEIRTRFNQSSNISEKSALFLYLNRHGYNGLCRYNSKNEFNVPFGSYKKPFFPEESMLAFHEKAQSVEFICGDFSEVMKKVKTGDSVYCDPPYVSLSDTAHFSAYYQGGFSGEQQSKLAKIAKELATQNITVLISNHDTKLTRELYDGAKINSFLVSRTISCKIENRKPVKELLALFTT